VSWSTTAWLILLIWMLWNCWVLFLAAERPFKKKTVGWDFRPGIISTAGSWECMVGYNFALHYFYESRGSAHKAISAQTSPLYKSYNGCTRYCIKLQASSDFFWTCGMIVILAKNMQARECGYKFSSNSPGLLILRNKLMWDEVCTRGLQII
jgi:hypothetical protein